MQYTRNTTMTKTDRDTLRSLHGRKKWEHIWAYYKLPIAIVLIVVYILGYAAYRHVTKKEDVLYLGLVNITAGSDLTEQLTTGFAEAQGLTKKQQVDLLSGLLLSESDRAEEQYVYASEMKLLGAVSAQRLDVVLMDEYARDRLLADDYFLDLRTLDASFHALSGLNAGGTVLDISDTPFVRQAGAYRIKIRRKRMDILTIGEVLIDLTQTGKDARGIPQFAANPGGAPANLAVAASRLGAQTAFIGKVGADAFGRYLKEVLAENKVDVSGMAVDADHPTTMAVVSVDATGERDFSFYRSANADVMLCKEDISDEALKAAKIVHFGSVSLTADPSRTATLDAAARAKKLGATITYDPNYRANLWKNKEDAIAQMKAPLPLVDILKVSDEELPLLTGTTDCESGTAQLAQNGIRLIFVTLGANGVFYRFGGKTGHVAGVPCKVGDTNGAGDTFFGAALSKLCKEELDTLTVDKLESILAFANKAASITTSRHGAIPAMPTLAEVEG